MEITNTTPLKPGRYWKSESVKYVLNKHFPHRKLVQKINIQCELHQGQYSTYYNINDIKSIIGENIFELIEHEFITHIIE
jgi:hypothetical protein